MGIDRRTFLLGSAIALCARSRALADVGGEAALASACRLADGRYAVVLLSLDGRIVREIALSDRGHDIAVDRERGRAIAFSRRPGTFAVAFATHGEAVPTVLAARDQRSFAGHGAYAADGRLLYATEADTETGGGLIGIYDVAAGYARIGEMATHGIDPHEVILLSDGLTLAVANGGIEMSGREKLNIAGMTPSLALLDARSGELKALHRLPAHLNLLSIRHIAADGRGQVWFGGQWEGGLDSAPELIGRAGLDSPLRLIVPAEPLGAALRGYIGSVTASGDGGVIAAAAPRAGRTVYIDVEHGTIVGETALADGCGVAAVGSTAFVLSSGHGDLVREAPGQPVQSAVTLAGVEFDNHLRRVG